ncbi:MAG: 5'-methylthioadenosine/S-adenosylhomocysteine nucleosidase [Verrucomicrobia bacterium]|nr:5'-methylthioadenosine/S-adenosylhomocysteine nucleosidase [Verrucomicrobiota bacterium]
MNLSPRFFLIFLLILASASGAERPLVAILGAYPPELVALRAEFGVEAKGSGFVTTSWRGIRFDRGVVAGHEVVIFQAGPSVVNAAFQLQMALDHFPITHVLFAGVAGGIDPALDVGDVVIPEKWAYHSEAAYLNEDGKGGYVRPDYLRASGLENFGMMFPDGVRAVRDGEGSPVNMMTFPIDAELLGLARKAVAKLPPMTKAGRKVSVSVGGTGVSGPVFLDNAKYREWVFRVWQARCLDMESTAYAHVCWANKKPLLVIRGLSDLAGGQHGKNPIDDNELSVSGIATKVLRGVLVEMPK